MSHQPVPCIVLRPLLVIFGAACGIQSADPPVSNRADESGHDGGQGGSLPDETGGSSAKGGEDSGGARFAELVVSDFLNVDPNVALGFDVPQNTFGFLMVVIPQENGQAAILELKNPYGEVAFLEAIPAGGQHATAFSNGPGLPCAAAVPQSDHSTMTSIVPGRWEASLYEVNGQPLSVKVMMQVTDDGQFHRAVLDLHLYIPDGLTISGPTSEHAVTAQDAKNDDAVVARVDAFYSALRDLYDVDRGDVAFHAIDPQFLHVDDELLNAANGQSQATSTSQSQALHVVWTNQLTYYGQDTWGLVQGIPSAGGIPGTASSAIVMSLLGTGTNSAIADGLTMLHEAGHFVGLNHTSELSPGYFDPIADTPECADIEATVEGLQVCPDKNNIMFPTFYGTTGGHGLVVSDAQKRVFQASPMLKLWPR